MGEEKDHGPVPVPASAWRAVGYGADIGMQRRGAPLPPMSHAAAAVVKVPADENANAWCSRPAPKRRTAAAAAVLVVTR